MRHALAIIATSAALLTSAACDDDPAVIASLAGTVTLELTTTHADDGALVFAVTGPPIDSATAASPSLRLFTRPVDGSVLVGLVAGGVARGPLVVAARARREADGRIQLANRRGGRPSERSARIAHGLRAIRDDSRRSDPAIRSSQVVSGSKRLVGSRGGWVVAGGGALGPTRHAARRARGALSPPGVPRCRRPGVMT